MMRLRLSILTKGEGGRVFLGPSAYTGLAYHVNEGGVVQTVEVFRDGLSAGPSEDCFELPLDGLRVDSSFLEVTEEGGPLLWQNEPFNGISYYFDDSGHCIEEELVENGEAVSGRGYFPSGERQYESNGADCLHWLEDGRIGAKDYQGLTVFRLTLNDAGELNWLVLRDASALDLAVLYSLHLATDFKISGQGADSRVLRAIAEHPDFPTVGQLRLVSTDVEGDDLVNVLRHRRLYPSGRSGVDIQGLELLGNPGVRSEDAARLATLWPACEVAFKPTQPRKGSEWFRNAQAYVNQFDGSSPALGASQRQASDLVDDIPRQAVVAKQAFENALKAYCVWRLPALSGDADRVVQHLLYHVPSPLAVLDKKAVHNERNRVQLLFPDRWAEGWKAVQLVRREAQRMFQGLTQLEVIKLIDAAQPALGVPNPPIADWKVIRAALGELFEKVHRAALSERGPD